MDVLATRVLKYRYDDGDEIDVVLTVFVPFKTERDDWKCGFQFSPPANQRVLYVYGVDFIQALLDCLKVARGYVEHPTEDRSSWQGMSHSGLPWHADKPASYHPPDVPPPEEAPLDLKVLTARELICPDEAGAASALVLTVYAPIQTNDQAWKCAFALGPPDCMQVRYGLGADFIEALLHALALARAAYERMVPSGWVAPESRELFDASSLPYNIGRSYWTEP